MNRERVQMLRDMIAGIPAKKMNLNEYFVKNGEPCGTIACIAGWACIYPPFKEQGFMKVTGSPYFGGFYGQGGAAAFFGVDRTTFAPRQKYEFGSHKSIAPRRLDALLATGTA